MITDTTNHVDLLVIGGGILGTFHAYHAVEQGLSVALVERHSAPRGATVRNFGQVIPSGLDRHWQQIGLRSLEIYNHLELHCDLTVRQLGSIYLASDEEEQTLLEELHLINQEADYESELWTAETCRQRYPHLRADYCVGGLYFPREVSVDPRQMIHRVHRFLQTKPNFESHFGVCITQLHGGGNSPVTAITSDEQCFTAENVVLCSGNEFQTLFPELMQSSEMVAVKLQMMRLKAQPEVTLPGNILTGLTIRRYESFQECPSWEQIHANEPEDSFWRKWGVHILFKQEIDGSIVLGDSHEYAPACQADNLTFDLRNDINEYFLSEARKIMDLPSWEVENSWYGAYAQINHPSGLLKKTINERIHIATGIGGKGMTVSAGWAEQHLKEILNDQACRI